MKSKNLISQTSTIPVHLNNKSNDINKKERKKKGGGGGGEKKKHEEKEGKENEQMIGLSYKLLINVKIVSHQK